jgi:hypothetical protein
MEARGRQLQGLCTCPDALFAPLLLINLACLVKASRDIRELPFVVRETSCSCTLDCTPNRNYRAAKARSKPVERPVTKLARAFPTCRARKVCALVPSGRTGGRKAPRASHLCLCLSSQRSLISSGPGGLTSLLLSHPIINSPMPSTLFHLLRQRNEVPLLPSTHLRLPSLGALQVLRN